MATTFHPADPARIHDIVVIGGSGGALEALRTVFSDLPTDLPASRQWAGPSPDVPVDIAWRPPLPPRSWLA
jgi:hypothetical protein